MPTVVYSLEVMEYKNHKIWYTHTVSGEYYEVSRNGFRIGDTYHNIEDAQCYIDEIGKERKDEAQR